MSCPYKGKCPSYSGWCEGPDQIFSRCIPFIITAYENEKEMSKELATIVKLQTRLCEVGDRMGYFHCWEHFSKPIEASPLIGGAPAGVFSQVFGIIEFSDSIERIDPAYIRFCDAGNEKN